MIRTAAVVYCAAALVPFAVPVRAAENTWCCCVPSDPAVVSGSSVTLSAWYAAPRGARVGYRWESLDGIGKIVTANGVTTWDFTGVDPEAIGTAGAAVRAIVNGKPAANSCTLEVVVVSPGQARRRGVGAAPLPAGPSLSTKRRFFTRNSSEEEGFGLYSYVLFQYSPATAAEKARYQAIFRAVVRRMNPIGLMPEKVDRKSINITALPVRGAVPDPEADDETLAKWLVENYDYRYAADLLTPDLLSKGGIKRGTALGSGIYIVSVPAPLSRNAAVKPFIQNLSSVQSDLAVTWVAFFINLAAQNRDWTTGIPYRFAMNLRNQIEIFAAAVPDVKNSIAQLIPLVK